MSKKHNAFCTLDSSPKKFCQSIRSHTFVYLVKSAHYRTVQFAPFEAVFVSEEPQRRMKFDFQLHPNIFKRNDTNYSAVINDRNIEFLAEKRTDFLDHSCEATVDEQSIGCEEILYSSGLDSIIDDGLSEFIHLTGDLGITAEQAQQLNEPHRLFEKQLKTAKLSSFIAILIIMLGWRVSQMRRGNNNTVFLKFISYVCVGIVIATVIVFVIGKFG